MAEIRFTQDEVLEVLNNEIADAGSLRAFAQASGFSPAYISKVVNGKLPPSATLAEVLGFRRERGFLFALTPAFGRSRKGDK